MEDEQTRKRDGLLSPSLSLGRVAGVRVGLNWSWLIAFVVIVWSLAASYFPSRYPLLTNGSYLVMALYAAALFFVSLLLHELGHAIQARREGMEIDGITLWLFGGVARFKAMFPSAGAELRIALAGPLVTLVLSGVFLASAALAPGSSALHGVLAWLGYVNVLLLVFNLIPALPLDGGRVLRSLLWRVRGDFGWATSIATEIARVLAFLMIAGGAVLVVFYGALTGFWLVLVGWFLLTAAGAERRYMQVREALTGLRVGDLMVRDRATAHPDQTVAAFLDATAGTSRHALYPVVRDDVLVGVLPFGRVARIPRDSWPRRAVGEYMLPAGELPVLREDDDLADAFAEINETDRAFAVVLRDGRLAGVLSFADIRRVFAESAPSSGGRPLKGPASADR
jgi:Zn-dependent protease